MPKIKIIYVAGYDLSRNTGRNRATLEKAQALEELLGRDNFALYYPRFSKNKMVRYLRMLFFDIRMIGKLLFINRETIVIQRQTLLFLTNTCLRLRKVRIVYEVHADLQDEIRLLDKSILEKAFLYLVSWMENFNFILASGVIYNHPLLREAMQSRYSGSSAWFYNGADTSMFYIKDTLACRKKLHLGQSAKYFLFLGMVSPWHGIDLLIQVFRQDAMKEYILLIVGAMENSYNTEMKRMAEGCSNILFIGHTDSGTAAEYINAADVCLLPVNLVRKSPGSPLKLYDYIACGKPVIAQAGVSGYSDEVIRYQLGTVTDFRDSAAAAEEMIRFYTSADWDLYRIKNREVAESDVSWRRRMEDWIVFLSSLK